MRSVCHAVVSDNRRSETDPHSMRQNDKIRYSIGSVSISARRSFPNVTVCRKVSATLHVTSLSSMVGDGLRESREVLSARTRKCAAGWDDVSAHA